MPARHGKRRRPPILADCGSSVLVGVVDRAVAIVRIGPVPIPELLDLRLLRARRPERH